MKKEFLSVETKLEILAVKEKVMPYVMSAWHTFYPAFILSMIYFVQENTFSSLKTDGIKAFVGSLLMIGFRAGGKALLPKIVAFFKNRQN